MKKWIGIAMVAVFGLACAFTPASKDEEVGIKFEQITYKEALAKAKKENKFIFIDCYTSWCGPCKRMAATSFKDAKVGEVYNSQFINLKMEMEKDAEGPELARLYKVKAYPTLLIVNGDGKVVKEVLGMQTVDGLLSFAESATMK